MLYQEYIIRDKVRIKEAELTFDKKKFEYKIIDLQNEISNLKEKHLSIIDEMRVKIDRAYKDKEQTVYALEQLQSDYLTLQVGIGDKFLGFEVLLA